MTSKKVKILLIDDSPILLGYLSELLTQRGIQVCTAQTIATALEAYYQQKPDAVLSDFILEAGETGLGAIQAIFAYADGASVVRRPAAILTRGALTAEDKQKALNLKIQIFEKPARGKEEEFMQNIEFWLNDSKLLG